MSDGERPCSTRIIVACACGHTAEVVHHHEQGFVERDWAEAFLALANDLFRTLRAERIALIADRAQLQRQIALAADLEYGDGSIAAQRLTEGYNPTAGIEVETYRA